jgi:uncharacterized membrane protein YjgN (DUF898 family)
VVNGWKERETTMETVSGGGADAAGERVTIAYLPQPGLLRIAIVNAILNLITLTIYRFWGRTRVRRHVWRCVHINGEPLEYTGTGGELFLGALIVFGVLGLPIGLVYLVLTIKLGPEHPALVGVNFLVFLLVALLWGMAVYRARRYRLSRTLWRGIRSALAGSSISYSLLYFGAQILRAITLGWSTPAMDVNLQERMFGDMRFGTMPFHFRGPAGPLYGRYAVSWFVAIVVFVLALVLIGTAIYAFFGTMLLEIFRTFDTTDQRPPSQETIWKLIAIVYAGFAVLIGAWFLQSLVWAFYVAREMNVFAAYTTIDKARFKFNATAASLMWLWIGNLLLVIFTLGVGAPFAQQRLVRYLCGRLSVEGTVNIAAVMQSRESLGRTGEGLADAFDIGGFI